MITSIILIVLCFCIVAATWYMAGKQKVGKLVLQEYKELAKVCRSQEIIIESYRRKYGELTDEETH